MCKLGHKAISDSCTFEIVDVLVWHWLMWTQAYAMTEASHQMTSNPLPKNGPHKAGTVGKAQGSVQIFILDNNNKPLPSGKIGEVCLRGPNVTKGYLNNPSANAEGFAGQYTAHLLQEAIHVSQEFFQSVKIQSS